MSRHGGASAHARTRLQQLAQQWRPTAPVPIETEPSSVWTALLDDDGGSSPDLMASHGPSGRSGVRLTGWTPSASRGLLVILAVAVALSGWWWWSGRPREAVAAPAITSLGAPLTGAGSTAAPPVGAPSAGPSTAGATDAASAVVIVHVVGQVKHPGLVTLPRGARVDDAINAAGGVTKSHAADSVNLARVLVDGEQVIVGFAAQAVAGALGITSAPTAGTLLNLNSADATAFENLPGVGPVLAQRIVQWRATNGPFRSVDELSEVSGIGDSIMSQIRPMVTV